MRWFQVSLWVAAAVLMTGGLAAAQTTTGTITGRVVDSQGRYAAGRHRHARSPSLQGVLTVVTSENGDYIFTLLPPGVYVVTFDLSGFQRAERTVPWRRPKPCRSNVTLGPAGITETVNVVGRRPTC